MVGRGTRKAPGKTDCLILDFVDSTSRHRLQTMGTLLGLEPDHQFGGRDVSESADHAKLALSKYGAGLLIPSDVSLDDLELLAVEVPLWDVNAEVNWSRLSNGWYAMETRDRYLRRIALVPLAPDQWTVRQVRLYPIPEDVPGFLPLARLHFGDTLPRHLRRTFSSRQKAEMAVVDWLMNPAIPQPDEDWALADWGDLLRDRRRPLWSPAGKTDSARLRTKSRTQFVLSAGSLLLVAELADGGWMVLGQLAFGRGHLDAYARKDGPSDARRRVETVLKHFAANVDDSLEMDSYSATDTWKWADRSLSSGRVPHFQRSVTLI
jgi:hypothetical protein